DVERAAREGREGARTVLGLLDLEALELEVGDERAEHRRLVVDDEDAGGAHGLTAATPARAGSAGIVIVNVVPLPGVVSRPIVALCRSTIDLTIASPSPVPLVFVVNRGWKIRSFTSGGMPAPSSAIRIDQGPSGPLAS